MCTPTLAAIGIGAALGATTSAITGQDPLMGALMGGAMGGFFPGSVGVGGVGLNPGTFFSFNPIKFAIGAAGSLGASSLMKSMQPEPMVGYTPATQYAQQQPLNTNVATTGSGGRQAAKSLATAISRTKKRKLTQDDVGDLSLDTSSFTNTGLQLA